MRVLLLATLMLTAPCLAGTPLPDSPHVVASGEGKVTVAPDLATVTISAQYRNPVAATAKQSVDRSIAAFLALAPQFGLGSQDVTASDLSLSEDVDYDQRDRRVSNGFIARREVNVRLRTIERLGEFLDAAVAAGLNEIDSVSFESTRKETLKLQARAKAVADAREKAAGLAEAFGTSLGAVYSINSVTSGLGDGYGGTLDRVQVTGSRARADTGRYLQPRVDYTERVSAVFELTKRQPSPAR